MSRPLALYLHVPFCASRCGYCDFNTYTAKELGDDVRRDTFHEYLIGEIEQAAQELAASHHISTVFVGGGTPTLLGSDALTQLIAVINSQFDVSPEIEVTTEANPDSVDSQMLDELRAGGFTRISFGMQSSAPHVLATLERTHSPGASSAAARAARDAGFEHVNLDLIYGTPGESDDDLRNSLEEVISAGVDHVSAYSLIVEPGTALARRVHRGEIPRPDDDIAADRYELIDDRLSAAGMDWYEVSNWARPDGECRHNLAYWSNADWWGIGPGAHSHLRGRRWWNVKHPHTYAQRMAAGLSPMQDAEVLTSQQQRLERVMLGLRLRQGLPLADADCSGALVDDLIDRDLLEAGPAAHEDARLVLTRRGRLLADAVVAEISSMSDGKPGLGAASAKSDNPT